MGGTPQKLVIEITIRYAELTLSTSRANDADENCVALIETILEILWKQVGEERRSDVDTC